MHRALRAGGLSRGAVSAWHIQRTLYDACWHLCLLLIACEYLLLGVTCFSGTLALSSLACAEDVAKRTSFVISAQDEPTSSFE